MKTDSNTLNLSTLGDIGLYVHIPFCKQKCVYCDFPAYQNLQDYYETYVYALVKRIIDIMNADIYIESTLGKGTTFTVKLDLNKNKIYNI